MRDETTRRDETSHIEIEAQITYTLSDTGRRVRIASGLPDDPKPTVKGSVGPDLVSLFRLPGRDHPCLWVEIDLLWDDPNEAWTVRTTYPGPQLETVYAHTRRDYDTPLSWDEALSEVVRLAAEKAEAEARLRPALEAALAEHAAHQAENEAKKAAEAERDAQWRARQALVAETTEARKKAGQARLRDWGEDHGSELLRARIEDGYEWEGLARREYAHDLLAGEVDVSALISSTDLTTVDRTRPTLDEITFARRLSRISGVTATPVWLPDADEFGASRAPYLELGVECPDGVTVWYVVPPSARIER